MFFFKNPLFAKNIRTLKKNQAFFLLLFYSKPMARKSRKITKFHNQHQYCSLCKKKVDSFFFRHVGKSNKSDFERIFGRIFVSGARICHRHFSSSQKLSPCSSPLDGEKWVENNSSPTAQRKRKREERKIQNCNFLPQSQDPLEEEPQQQQKQQQKQIQQLQKLIEEQQQQIQQLQQQQKQQQQQQQQQQPFTKSRPKTLLSYDDLKDNNARVHSFTGFKNWLQLNEFVTEMVPVVEKISLSNNNSKIAKNRSSGRPSEIRPEDLIFIFLFRLYVGETIERISCYFGISCSWICRILASVTVAISCKLKPELKIFSGQELQDRTIERTKLNFPNQDVCITPCLYYSSPSLTSNYIYFLFSAKVHVLDTTYVYFDRPSNVEAQRLSFCPNKQRNLIKVLTLSTTNGTGEAVDFAWGSQSNRAILKKTALFDPITTKAMVLGDKGFSNVSSKKKTSPSSLPLLTGMDL